MARYWHAKRGSRAHTSLVRSSTLDAGGRGSKIRVGPTAAVAITAVALATAVGASAQGTSYDDCRTSSQPKVHQGSKQTEMAVCVPAGEHTTYSGGDEAPCGVIVAGGVVVAGSPYRDPATECWGEPERGWGVEGQLYRPAIRSKGGVVAARSPLAANAGIKALEKGGNAIDAAAAATFAAGVVRPEMCGIGGGGFLVYRSAAGEVATLDFSEVTPAATTPELYEPYGRDEFSVGYRVIGVPGTVAGMDAAVKRFGKRTLAEAIAPAVELARDGFAVSTALTTRYAGFEQLTWDLDGDGPFVDSGSPYANTVRLAMDPEARKTYLPDGVPPKPGSTLRLTDYANTLEMIADRGADAFYKGAIAKKIIAAVKKSQDSPLGGDRGIMTKEDLKDYRAIWQTPLSGTYRDARIFTVGPSSAGGTFLIESLNILEGFDLETQGHSSARHLHLLAETQELAWADVREHVDPESEHSIATLTSKDWAAERRKLITDTASKNRTAGPIEGGGNTLHLSVLDAQGNAAAVTCSLGSLFGAAVVPEGTGFLLNDEMPSGDGKNELKGGRHFRSAKTPVIVVRDGLPILVTGGAGGSTIPMGVLNAVSNAVDFGMDPARAIDAARVDAIFAGRRLALEARRILEDELWKLREVHKHEFGGGPEYDFGPILAAVGVDPATGEHLASDDPREERGPAAQAVKSSP